MRVSVAGLGDDLLLRAADLEPLQGLQADDSHRQAVNVLAYEDPSMKGYFPPASATPSRRGWQRCSATFGVQWLAGRF
ncbi:MAG: hypothetical protein JWN32_1916 [Solirubrobacterales bacterium]|nr:hypothetical protein [Solirubrobacterales bacterium]